MEKSNKSWFVGLIIGLFIGAAAPVSWFFLSHAHGEHKGHGHGSHKGHDHGSHAGFDHDSHKGHDNHKGHNHGDHKDDPHKGEPSIRFTQKQILEFGLEYAVANKGKLATGLTLKGEIQINNDKLAHVVPRVGGIVRGVYKKAGDFVKKGTVLARIQSRELANLKATYLSTKQWLSFARKTYSRDKGLRRDRIISEEKLLKSKERLALAKIRHNEAFQKLLAVGLSKKYLSKFSKGSASTLTSFYIRAPITGTIIQKHITQGEKASIDQRVFTIANLKTVWVDLRVYQKDLFRIKKKQKVLVKDILGNHEGLGDIFYISSIVDEKTRTAIARISLPNKDKKWRPGMFVSGQVLSKKIDVPLLVKRSSIEQIEGKPSIFLVTKKGFVLHHVTLGRKDAQFVEVLKGLRPDQLYVAKGGFIIKSEMAKSSFGHGHAH